MADQSIRDLIEEAVDDRLNDEGMVWWTDAPEADGDGQIVEGFKGDVIRAVVDAVARHVVPEIQARALEEAADALEWSGVTSARERVIADIRARAEELRKGEGA